MSLVIWLRMGNLGIEHVLYKSQNCPVRHSWTPFSFHSDNSLLFFFRKPSFQVISSPGLFTMMSDASAGRLPYCYAIFHVSNLDYPSAVAFTSGQPGCAAEKPSLFQRIISANNNEVSIGEWPFPSKRCIFIKIFEKNGGKLVCPLRPGDKFLSLLPLSLCNFTSLRFLENHCR